MSIHNGDDAKYDNFLLTQVNITEDPSNPSLAVQSIKNSLLFKECLVDDILVLESDKFLVKNLIVHRFKVVNRIDSKFVRPVLVPFYKSAEFEFALIQIQVQSSRVKSNRVELSRVKSSRIESNRVNTSPDV